MRCIIGGSLAASIIATAAAVAEEPRWEQIRWAAACETFHTPTAGLVPCDKAGTEFAITDRDHLAFWYDDEQKNTKMIFFDHSNDGDAVPRHAQVPGIFEVTEVTDGALPVFHSRTDASGYCDMREGHIRCKSQTIQAST